MIKKIYNEIGLIKIFKYVFYTFALIIFKLMLFPPLKVYFLRLFGAKIGKNCLLHNISFFNLYRGSFANLKIGNNCFIGDETLLDMADKIILEDHVTLAEKVIILTHMNVGFIDHPLQKYFPKFNKKVVLKKGCFIGCNATILPGITINESSLIAAGSVVNTNISSFSIFGGVPAKLIKKLE